MALTPDIINSCFEVGGGLFLLLHVRQLLIDKQVKGFSTLPFVWFTSWGFWNIFYYPHLGQTYSFYAGIFIASVNFFYILLVIYYKYVRGNKG